MLPDHKKAPEPKLRSFFSTDELALSERIRYLPMHRVLFGSNGHHFLAVVFLPLDGSAGAILLMP